MSENRRSTTSHEGAAVVWVIFLSIVLFSGKPDLHDLVIQWLTKVAG